MSYGYLRRDRNREGLMVKATIDRQATILKELDDRFSRPERKPGGVSASEYAEQRNIHRNTAKNRLDRLVKDGLMYSEWCTMREGERGNGETVYYLSKKIGSTLNKTKEIIK